MVGRPKLAPGVGRTVMVFTRITPREKMLLEERAGELGKSGAAIVRHALLAFLNGGAAVAAADAAGAAAEQTPR